MNFPAESNTPHEIPNPEEKPRQEFSDQVEHFRPILLHAGLDSKLVKKFLTILERDIGFFGKFQDIWFRIRNHPEQNILLAAIKRALIDTQGTFTLEDRDDLSEVAELLAEKGHGFTDAEWLYLEIINRKDIKHDVLERIGEDHHHHHAHGVEIFNHLHIVEKELQHMEHDHGIPHPPSSTNEASERESENFSTHKNKIHHRAEEERPKEEPPVENEPPPQPILPEIVEDLPDNDDDQTV